MTDLARRQSDKGLGLSEGVGGIFLGSEERRKQKTIMMMTITKPSPRALSNGVEAIH
jgi:hypothetical protein